AQALAGRAEAGAVVAGRASSDLPKHARARAPRCDCTRRQPDPLRRARRGDRRSRGRRLAVGASFTRVELAPPLLARGAVAAAGCGGGGGPRLSKDELIKQGDAICSKYRKKNRELNKEAPAKSPTDPSATDAQVKASAPILEKLGANVRAAQAELA